jgi:hypothetical protein
MNWNLFKGKKVKTDPALERHEAVLTAIARLHNQVVDLKEKLADLTKRKSTVDGKLAEEGREAWEVQVDAKGAPVSIVRLGEEPPVAVPGGRRKRCLLTDAEAESIRKIIGERDG